MTKQKLRDVTRKASWMPCPKTITQFPGLAYIYALDELIVVKQADDLHDLIGGDRNGYTIFNSQGQKVFLAVEKKSCGKFDITVLNRYGNEVVQVERPFNPFFNRVKVWAPPGNYIGIVKELKSCISTFVVKNLNGIEVYKIKARGYNNFAYEILWNHQMIGKVENNWKMHGAFNVERFGLSFAEDTTVLDKAVLLGACFLIGCLKY